MKETDFVCFHKWPKLYVLLYIEIFLGWTTDVKV